MEIYRNFLFENSLTGIIKPKFTRRNEIWCRILEIEDLSKNVLKTQDWTSLIWFLNNIIFVIEYLLFYYKKYEINTRANAGKNLTLQYLMGTCYWNIYILNVLIIYHHLFKIHARYLWIKIYQIIVINSCVLEI